jgi:hypothetical protein
MPKSKITFECHYEQDPVKAQQAMNAGMDYLCYLADKEGWFDGILNAKSSIAHHTDRSCTAHNPER